MIQRIAAIDRFFAAFERTYLEISYLRNLIPERTIKNGNLTVYRINLFVCLPLILWLVLKAKCVYVHSIGNAQFILPFYFIRKIITDMHGTAPEEFRYSGRNVVAFRYGLTESAVISGGGPLVTVTQNMADHFKTKYGRRNLEFFNIPVFEDIEIRKDRKRPATDKRTIIYAGGSQSWQNVDLMFSVISKTCSSFRYVILTGDTAFFTSKATEYGLSCDVEIKSVAKEEVQAYYLSADFGFVLRDDNIVNRVACPTKLMEYMASGVIPVVIQPHIGDFAHLGYSYVAVDRLIAGDLPDTYKIEAMRSNNYMIMETMQKAATEEATQMATRYAV